MKAVFVELPAFERHRQEYLDDDSCSDGAEFWLFALYDKDEASDLTPKQRALLRERTKDELKMRRKA